MSKFQDHYTKIRYERNIHLLSSNQKEEILDIIRIIGQKRYYRGKGGQMMRVSVCRFI